MRTPISHIGAGNEFEQRLAAAEHSAWRWEQQPAYVMADEDPLFSAFLAGQWLPATSEPGTQAWLDQVRAQTRRGVAVGRVRVLEDPPTDYQRWLLWMDRWNVEAGEQIYYLSRQELATMAPAPFGSDDWWLIDNAQLLIMSMDEDGRRTGVDLSTVPADISAAVDWRWRVSARAKRALGTRAA